MNFMISLLGWFVWNIAELVIRQKELEEDNDPSTNFYFGEYASKKKYTWIGSVACVPILLWIGYRQLNLDPLASIVGHPLGWNDLYLLGSGLFFELVIFLVIYARRFFKKRETQ
jgi:hypothetical protein